MKKFLLCVSMAALFAACSYQPSTNNNASLADSTVVDSTIVQPIDTTVAVVDSI